VAVYVSVKVGGGSLFIMYRISRCRKKHYRELERVMFTQVKRVTVAVIKVIKLQDNREKLLAQIIKLNHD